MTNEQFTDVEPLAATWAVVEAKQSLPATIAVVGATERDDTVSVARGLARAAVQAGRRTACLSLTGGVARNGYDVLSLPLESGAAYFESAKVWRTQYEVLIVEVPRILATTLGARVARSADGVIVALYGDRGIGEQDRRLGAFLEHLGASTIGIVRTKAAARVKDAPSLRLSFKGMGRSLRSLVFRT